jgi:hypothetical protein
MMKKKYFLRHPIMLKMQWHHEKYKFCTFTMCLGNLYFDWAIQENKFFYHFEEFDLNNLIQQKHLNFML